MYFSSVTDYLVALKSDPSLAVISMQMAADFREVSRAAIDGLVSRRELEEIKIGKTRCVRVSSLLEKEKAYGDKVTTVRGMLEKLARKELTTYYDPVMEPLELRTNSPPDRKLIGGILGDVSEQTHKEYGVLLSVIVHKKTTGKTRPSSGFFDLAKSLGYEWKDEGEFVDTQMRKVFRHYAKHR